MQVAVDIGSEVLVLSLCTSFLSFLLDITSSWLTKEIEPSKGVPLLLSHAFFTLEAASSSPILKRSPMRPFREGHELTLFDISWKTRTEVIIDAPF